MKQEGGLQKIRQGKSIQLFVEIVGTFRTLAGHI